MMNIDALIEDLLDTLREAQWHLELIETDAPLLPPSLQERYPSTPPSLTTFLKRFSRCTNSDETIWFLTRHDYANHMKDDCFHWNEFELISLQAAADSKDSEWQEDIRKFWNGHFPFLMAGDDYLAVDVSTENYGQIVWGFAPEFEEVTTVASSFQEFLKLYAHDMKHGRSETLYAFINDCNQVSVE